MRRLNVLASLVACFAAALAFAHEGGDCSAFTWDVSRELAAMRTPAIPVAATVKSAPESPALSLGKHYSATLQPQDSVTFVAPPARQRKADKPMAGLLHFKTEKAGRYRVALSSRHWIDLLDGAAMIDSTSHEGRGGCALIHKVVEFELPASRVITLQLSGGDAAVVGITVKLVG